MEILHVLGKSYGGIRQHVGELDIELGNRGFESVLAGPADVMKGLTHQEFTIPTPTPRKPFSVLRSVLILRKATQSADVLHAHGITAGYLLWFSNWFNKNKPIVLTTHNVAHKDVLGRSFHIVKFFQTFILKRVDEIICPSQYALDQLSLNEKIKRKTSIVLPVSPVFSDRQKTDAKNSIRTIKQEYEICEEEILLTCLARISPDKDLKTLIDAFAIASMSISSLKLLIAGRGNEFETVKLENYILQKNLQSSVKLIGFIETPEKLLGASDLVVLSSICETVPLVLLESLQLGVPIIMTSVGVGPQILNNECGQCVAVGDSLAFARAIESWSQRVRSNTIDSKAIENRICDLLDKDKSVAPLVDIYTRLGQK